MQTGKAAPFISEKSVRQALNALLPSGNAALPVSIQSLSFVREQLIGENSPPTAAELHHFIIRDLLCDLITGRLTELRRIFGLRPPQKNDDESSVIAALRQDIRHNSEELAAWSLLYYRYVRTELPFSPAILEQSTALTERTLRRRQLLGVRLLTDLLIEQERRSLHKQRRHRLYTEIPGDWQQVLVGRDKVLAELIPVFVQQPAGIVCITGGVGIGKTTLVRAVLGQLIKRDVLDKLVWLQFPASPDAVRTALYDRLLLPEWHITLREFLLLTRTAIVLDAADQLIQPGFIGEFEALLGELMPALVFVTSQVRAPLTTSAVYVLLRELEQDAALELLKQMMASGSESFSVDECTGIYRAVGGNPLALRLAGSGLLQGSADTYAVDAVNRLFRQLYDALNAGARQAWCAFALLDERGISIDTIQSIWALRAEDVETLTRRHILETWRAASVLYRLPTAQRRFIELAYPYDAAVREQIHTLIQQLDAVVSEPKHEILGIFEGVLAAQWLQLPDDLRMRWIKHLWQGGLEYGSMQVWVQQLDWYQSHMPEPDLIMYTAYARGLRRTGSFTPAVGVLQHVIEQSGRRGDFLQQARAQLELAILRRKQGYYQQAVELLERAEAVVARRTGGSIELGQRISLEMAQIAVDTADGRAAQVHLADLLPEPEVLALRAEAHLLLGEFKQCFAAGQSVITNPDTGSYLRAQAHTIFARCAEQLGQLDEACDQFATALRLFEKIGDVFAIARVRSNLAAVLIRLEQQEEIPTFGEARALLNAARHAQVILSDPVGLSVTEANLRLLDQLDTEF